MRTTCARTSTLAWLLVLPALPSCLCGVMSERATSLAEWPGPRTLQVAVGSGIGTAGVNEPVILIGTPQLLETPDECAVLGDDARWFAGDAGNSQFDHGSVEYSSTGGGDLTFGIFISPFCAPPRHEVPIDEAIGEDDRIAIGFADDTDSWSVTMRRPPTRPAFQLVDLEPDAVVTRGQQVTLRSNTPLDGPDTRIDVGFSQCQTAEPLECFLDPVFRVEGSELLVVTVPNNAASEGATITVDVFESFRGEDCTADACEADSELIWNGSASVVVQ